MAPVKKKSVNDIENFRPVNKKRGLNVTNTHGLKLDILEEMGVSTLNEDSSSHSGESIQSNSLAGKAKANETDDFKMDAQTKDDEDSITEIGTNQIKASTEKSVRSPLSKVDYNNQCIDILPSTSKQAYLRHQKLLSQKPGQLNLRMCGDFDNSFFLYRDKTILKMNANEDFFGNLSDEILLQILQFLPKKALTRFSTVSSQFSRCTADGVLWKRLDLASRFLRSKAMQDILVRKVQILRLAKARLPDPVFSDNFVNSGFKARLQYLDLSYAAISTEGLEMLLSICVNLKRLSLELLELNEGVCKVLANCTNMDVLNLAMCTGLDAKCIKLFLGSLKKLVSLNIAWTGLSSDAVSAVCSNISPNIMRLNISGCRKTLTDTHVAILMKRCEDLIELDLSDCTALTGETINQIVKSKSLEYLSISRCYQIPASNLLTLIGMSSLKYLDVFGLLATNSLGYVIDALPSLQLNKFFYSCVARPTVGTARCSIWGLPTQDHFHSRSSSGSSS